MKKFFLSILIVIMGSTFSSCMMMMPGHMAGTMQGGHNHEHPTGKVDPVCGKHIGETSAFTHAKNCKSWKQQLKTTII